MAVTALVLGVLSVLLACFPFITIFLAVAAIVLGFLARRRARAGQAGGAGLATAGLVTGVVGVVLSVVVLILGARFAECASLPTQAEQQRCIQDRAS